MTKYLKKDTKLNLNDPEYEKSFNTLKTLLFNDPILAYPDFTKTFTLTTDASNYALGAILLIVSFTGQPPNMPYLFGCKFLIETDHKPLTWLFSIKEPNSKLVRWKLKLSKFNYEIKYKKGTKNGNTNALSRIEPESVSINALESSNVTIRETSSPINIFKNQKLDRETAITLLKNHFNPSKLNAILIDHTMFHPYRGPVYKELITRIYNPHFINNCEVCNLEKYDRKPPKIPYKITETPFKPRKIISDIERLHNTINEHIRLLRHHNRNKDETMEDKMTRIIGFYNNTIHSTTGIKPIDFLNGKIHEDKYKEIHDLINHKKEKYIQKLNEYRKDIELKDGTKNIKQIRDGKNHTKYRKVNANKIHNDHLQTVKTGHKYNKTHMTTWTIILTLFMTTNAQYLVIQDLTYNGYIPIKLDDIRPIETYSKIIHIINITIIKRGNLLGKGLKITTGTMDSEDEEHINYSLKQLYENNGLLTKTIHNLTLINNFFSDQIKNIIYHINIQEIHVGKYLNQFKNIFQNKIATLEDEILFMQHIYQINNDIALLRNHIDDIGQVVFSSKLGIIKTDILTPKEMDLITDFDSYVNIKTSVALHDGNILLIFKIPLYSQNTLSKITFEPIPDPKNKTLAVETYTFSGVKLCILNSTIGIYTFKGTAPSDTLLTMSDLNAFIRASDRVVQFYAYFSSIPQDDHTIHTLEIQKDEITHLWSSLRTVYDSLLSQLGSDNSDVSLTTVQNKFFVAYDAHLKCLSRANELLDQISNKATTIVDNMEFRNLQTPNISLPPCDTDIFYGDNVSWPSLRDMFSALYRNNPRLSPVEKLYHLLKKTQNEARDIVLKWHGTILLRDTKTRNLDPIQKESGNETDKWDVIFVYLCSTCLPDVTLDLWKQHHRSTNGLPTWKQMNEFLTSRYQTLESFADIRSSKPHSTTVKNNSPPKSHTSCDVKKFNTYNTNVAPNKSVNKPTKCCLCSDLHSLQKYPTFLKMSVEDRSSLVRNQKRCFNCLACSHDYRKCLSKFVCLYCKQKHHTLLHRTLILSKNNQDSGHNTQDEANPPTLTNPVNPPSTSTAAAAQNHQTFSTRLQSTQDKFILLGTALADVCFGDVRLTVRALIDSASEASFVSSSLKRRLSLPYRFSGTQVTGLNEAITSICTILIGSTIDKFFSIKVNAFVFRKLTGELPYQSILSSLETRFDGLQLADSSLRKGNQVDLLLGGDIYPQVLREGVKWDNDHNLIRSPAPCRTVSSFYNEVDLNLQLTRFWELEEVQTARLMMAGHQALILPGYHTKLEHPDLISSKVLTVSTRKKFQSFNVQMVSTRLYREYSMVSTNKKHNHTLSNKHKPDHPLEIKTMTRELTTYRNQEGRFVVSLPFKKEYSVEQNLGNSRDSAIAQYLRNEARMVKQSATKYNNDKVISEYLTLHHMVKVHPDLSTNPNTSTTTKLRVVFNASNPSSNGAYSDMSLTPISRKCIDKTQTPFQRIIFRQPPDDQLSDFEMLTVIFGVNCAPYLAIRTLLELAKQCETDFPMVADILRNYMYVDDVLFGSHDLSTALQARKDLTQVLNTWTANHKVLLQDVQPEHLLDSNFLNLSDSCTSKTLGLRWNAGNNCFYFEPFKFSADNSFTKRVVLLFYIIVAKIIMQQIWKDETGWDEVIAPSTLKQWLAFLEDYSNLKHIQIPLAMRVLCYVFRFFHKISPSHNFHYESNDLLQSEMKHVKQRLVIMCQKLHFPEYKVLARGLPVSRKSDLLALNPFIDPERTMRVNGRLSQSPTLTYDEKFPKILPYNGKFTRLYLELIHKSSIHGENSVLLRLMHVEFWVPKLKNLTKFVVRNCKDCVLQRHIRSKQIMGMLPPERTTLSRPFTNTGVDFAGPFDLKSYAGRGCKLTKGYVLVFVCFSTKAIHLELTSEISTSAFMAAFSRFFSRRGCPHVMFSDNGTAFVGAANILDRDRTNFLSLGRQGLLNQFVFQSIDWRFIPPGAPHMGGLWEAGVKSFKTHLKKVTHAQAFTYEEFSTMLIRIEASPLLTPAEPDSSQQCLNYINRWQKLKVLHHHFAERRYPQRNFADNLPPNQWRLGRIEKVICGPDLKVRVCEVRTSNGLITPIMSTMPRRLRINRNSSNDVPASQRENALVVRSSRLKDCRYCNMDHPLWKCLRFKRLSVRERWNVVRKIAVVMIDVENAFLNIIRSYILPKQTVAGTDETTNFNKIENDNNNITANVAKEYSSLSFEDEPRRCPGMELWGLKVGFYILKALEEILKKYAWTYNLYLIISEL
ncbi:Retrovirus-related Pol polyprotein from transposon 17.6 [Lucilia cuprina]|nr:Retrovirus-related Pol polyprotein from transposon 17.6 [Lucilia cuprina]